MPPALCFLGFLWLLRIFCTNFRIIFSISMKNAFDSLIRIALDLWLIGQYGHFINVNSSSSWTQNIFPVSLQFLSSKAYSFPCTANSHLWIHLFSSILLFLMQLWMGYCYFFFRYIILNAITFNLLLYPATLLNVLTIYKFLSWVFRIVCVIIWKSLQFCFFLQFGNLLFYLYSLSSW